MTDSDVIARLMYRAYIQPDPHAPLEAEALLPFREALDLYARAANAESRAGGDISESDTAPPAGAVQPGAFAGVGKTEKTEIYARLMAFCATHGLGARRMIAEASGGKLTLVAVQDLTDAKRRQIQDWRAAAEAMNRIEAEEG